MTSLPGYDPSDYPPFAVTVDIVVFTVVDGRLLVALIERANEPFEGRLAIPGGFVDPDEGLRSAAMRELSEETGLHSPAHHLTQLGAYGDPDRDPRMRVVTVAYWAAVPRLEAPVAGSDAASAQLVEVTEALADPSRLAFDHHVVLTDALEQLRRSLETTTVATGFCHDEFTLSELRSVYEAVWDRELDPANFQRKVTGTPGFVEPTGAQRRSGPGRPAELYRAGPAEVIEPPYRRPGTA